MKVRGVNKEGFPPPPYFGRIEEGATGAPHYYLLPGPPSFRHPFDTPESKC